MENGQGNFELRRAQSSNMFSAPFFPGETMGWNPHINDTSQDVDPNDNGARPGVLTRRRWAALNVGRTVGNDTAPVFPASPQLDFGFPYGSHSHLEPLSNPVTPSSGIHLHLNPSANPADISPPARRSHARHSSDAFSPRASSPASSIATTSSSIASLLSYSTSTWSSTTGESSPARSIGEPKSKHTKNKLRNSDRKDMCMFAEQFPDMKQEDIALKYGVERSTVSKVLKKKDVWLNIEDEHALKIIKHRPVKFPEVDSAVLKWMQERSAPGEPISDTALREQARAIARQLGIGDDQFKASGGWIENFKQRHKIRRGKLANERAERGVSARRGSVSTTGGGGDLEETAGRRRGMGGGGGGAGGGNNVIATNGLNNAVDAYAELYRSGTFSPPKKGVVVGSGGGGGGDDESISSSAESGSVHVEDDSGGVAPMMAAFTLADKRTLSPAGMAPPPAIVSRANESPRPTANLSRSPRMFGSPAGSSSSNNNNNIAAPTSVVAPVAAAQEHGYNGTRSKTISAAQLQQSVRVMSAFIRDVYPDGFTDDQREMWEVIAGRTIEWAKAHTNGSAVAEVDVAMGSDGGIVEVAAGVVNAEGEKQGKTSRTRSRGSNGL